MAYTKTNWTNNTPINPANLNKIEEGIEQNSKNIETNTDAINKVINYSTDEKRIGTWLGKTLYRKVIEVGDLPNNGTKEVEHGISNLDFVVNLTGAITNGDNCMSLPRIHTTSSLNIVLEISKTKVVIYDEYDFSTYTGYVIVEYTKTTD